MDAPNIQIQAYELTFSEKMSLEALTDNIIQLSEECKVWSSTINVPHGNHGDILARLHQRVWKWPSGANDRVTMFHSPNIC